MTLAEFHPKQLSLSKFGITALNKRNMPGNKMAKDKKSEKMPEHKIRVGSVTATIWKNTHENKEGKEFDIFNTDITRSYLDKKEEWQTTSSFGLNDLPKVMAACQAAFNFIAVKEESKDDD